MIADLPSFKVFEFSLIFGVLVASVAARVRPRVRATPLSNRNKRNNRCYERCAVTMCQNHIMGDCDVYMHSRSRAIGYFGQICVFLRPKNRSRGAQNSLNPPGIIVPVHEINRHRRGNEKRRHLHQKSFQTQNQNCYHHLNLRYPHLPLQSPRLRL